MGDYFEELVPDYTVELPVSEGLESLRRLLFMFKVAINGKACVLINATEETAIAISPEFESEFGHTFAEFEAMDAEDFFHEDSLTVAETHGDNNLAAPYAAKCKKSDESYAWYTIQGLSVIVDNITWRMLSFESI